MNEQALTKPSNGRVSALAVVDENNSAVQYYHNASMLKITEEEAKILDEPINEIDIEIRPDGLIYPPQVYWRDKLNKAFGRGQWALIQHAVTKDAAKNKLYFDGSLFIRSCFVSRAVGEQEYHETNPLQSWGSAYEGAKSDCLGRNCKDLGIFKELWQPNFVREWIQKYGVKVFVEIEKNKQKKTVVQWRRIDSQPYWNEKGIVPDSPNKPGNFNKTTSNNNKSPQNSNTKVTDKNKSDNENLTAQKPMTDKAVKDELKRLAKTDNGMNDLRILYNRVQKTNAKQFEKLKGEFTKTRESIEKNKAEKEASKNNGDIEEATFEDIVDKVKKDQFNALTETIKSLTVKMFERGDWKSIEKLIDDIKDYTEKQIYTDFYCKKLETLGIRDHKPNIKGVELSL